MRIYNQTRKQDVGKVRCADHFISRLFGFLGQRPKSEGLWLIPCSSIHTLGMRWSLDIIFLDKEFKVIQCVGPVKPFSPWVACPKAHSVLEFFSGYWDFSKIGEGDQLQWRK